MSPWPLIKREMGEQARRPLNYGLRALGAAALLTSTWYLVAGPRSRIPLPGPWVLGTATGGRFVQRIGPVPDDAGLDRVGAVLRLLEGRGADLFAVMNLVLFLAVWFVAPLLTADCISRERREGTLGLLFLTPLKARDVVLAKLAAHGLRASSLFVGALPVLMLPVLLGGVTWVDAARAALLDLSALIIALCAGLRASTRWQGPRAVAFGSLVLAGLLAAGWLFLGCLARAGWERGIGDPMVLMVSAGEAVLRYAGMAVEILVRGPDSMVFRIAMRRVPTGGTTALAWAGTLLGMAMLLAWWEVRGAAKAVSRAQREGRRADRVEAVEAFLGKPRFFGSLWRGLRERILGSNPVLWVELRTWRLRVAPWLVLLVLILAEWWWIDAWMARGWQGAGTPVSILCGLAALLAASALHGERTSGVLELLLTVPGGVRSVLWGKLGAAGLQLGPAIVVIWASEGWLLAMFGAGGGFARSWLAGGLEMFGRLALSVAAGLYFSLRFRAFVPALAATLAVGAIGVVVAPWLLRVGFGMGEFRLVGSPLVHSMEVHLPFRFQLALVQGLLALGFLFGLHRALSRRSFASS